MREPGFPDAAGLLGLLGAAWAGARRTRLPKLGCHANRAMLPPITRPVPAPPGRRRKHDEGDKRREEQQKPQAPGGTTHMNRQRNQKTGGTFFCGEKQDDKIFLLYTCMHVYMYIHVCKFMT